MIIAEISANHLGDFDRAIKLIDCAKFAEADAVKFQAYHPDSMTIDHPSQAFQITEGQWAGKSLYELYTEAQTPFEWFPKLFAHARQLGLTPFASVFDRASVDFLETLDCPIYKIASFEITDTPLIEYVGTKNKPIIISTGMASNSDVLDAIEASHEPRNLSLLHCVSAYPTDVEQANLGRIRDLRSYFGLPVGISDHTRDSIVPVAATAMGAEIIEKHLTIDRNDGGPDAAFSLEPDEFYFMVRSVQATRSAMQVTNAKPYESLRRSLYVVKDMSDGEPFTIENTKSIRPGFGLPPKTLPEILGRKAKGSIGRGTPLSSELIV